MRVRCKMPNMAVNAIQKISIYNQLAKLAQRLLPYGKKASRQQRPWTQPSRASVLLLEPVQVIISKSRIREEGWPGRGYFRVRAACCAAG